MCHSTIPTPSTVPRVAPEPCVHGGVTRLCDFPVEVGEGGVGCTRHRRTHRRGARLAWRGTVLLFLRCSTFGLCLPRRFEGTATPPQRTTTRSTTKHRPTTTVTPPQLDCQRKSTSQAGGLGEAFPPSNFYFLSVMSHDQHAGGSTGINLQQGSHLPYKTTVQKQKIGKDKASVFTTPCLRSYKTQQSLANRQPRWAERCSSCHASPPERVPFITPPYSSSSLLPNFPFIMRS